MTESLATRAANSSSSKTDRRVGPGRLPRPPISPSSTLAASRRSTTQRRELADGWVAITDGLISGVGTGAPPAAATTIDATECLVTPGLVNAHHHLYQNLTRAFPPMTDKPLFGWLQSLYPLWRRIDTESVYVSAWVGLAELALSGCTTSSDHLYLHPHGAGDLLDGGDRRGTRPRDALPSDARVDVAVGEGRRAAARRCRRRRRRDPRRLRGRRAPTSRPAFGAMTRVALAPCSPFSVTEDLMVRTAELAERLDVRLHTHFAENAEDDEFSLATFGCRPMEYLERTGWCTDRTWVAHCVMPDDDEIRPPRCGRRGCCALPVEQPDPVRRVSPRSSICVRPVSRSASASTVRRRPTVRRCGWRRARRCCSRSSATVPAPGPPGWRSRWPRSAAPAASDARARSARSTVGAVGDVAVWSLTGPSFAGAIADPVEAWLRCGPTGARDTIVHGRAVVRDGVLVSDRLDEMLAAHDTLARRIQRLPASGVGLTHPATLRSGSDRPATCDEDRPGMTPGAPHVSPDCAA